MEEVQYAIQDKYADNFSWCYGCGRLNEEGLHLRTGWHGKETLTIYKPQEEHTAIPGFVYGGLLASLIDCHGTASASLALHRKHGHEPEDDEEPPRFVTGSLHVDFIKPTPQGITLSVVGAIEEMHAKKWRVTIKVFAAGVCCATGEVIAVVMPKTFTQQS